MNRTAVVFLPLLVACGVSRDKFATQFPEKFCALEMECSSSGSDSGFSLFETQEDCEGFVGLFVALSADCDYDKAAAKACLDALDEATCDDDGFNSECDNVFTGGSCEGGGDSGF